MTVWRTIGVVILAMSAGEVRTSAWAQGTAKPSQAQTEFFEAKIRPVLVKHCYDCHSVESGAAEGGLSLDTRNGIRAGGERGPAVVPGDPAGSRLLAAISHTDPDLIMPPKQERLPDSVIADFKKWIEMGAPDPRVVEPQSRPGAWDNVEKAREFWAYQAPQRHALPPVADASWPRREIDHFIWAALDGQNLEPSADASSEELLRRLHFDLVGLPPTPADVQRFRERVARAGMDEALSLEVDELLARPQYGERWGRHWLDVARYAESSGKAANISYPYAWRYRDYVIDCFNDDLPYDRFLVEQLAGDQLPHESPEERARLLVATGFLAIGAKDLDATNKLQFHADLIDEQIDTLTRAVMGSTVACARCHDHKFDPFTMEDYYALAGIFLSTENYYGTEVSPANRIGGDPLLLPQFDGQQIFHRSIPAKQVKKLNDDLAALQKEERDGRAAVLKAIKEGRDASNIFTLTDALRIFWRSGAIRGQLEKVDAQGNALPLAMGVLDREKPVDAPLLVRGEISRPGDPVPRRFPRVFELASVPQIPEGRSGRLELARWLTAADHPLTSRVMVNRIWHHLMGAGLVATEDNFGTTGDLPSHPELLDHLAVEFVESGWSIKQMVRNIVLSRAYRQASTFRQEAFLADPDNRLLWRMPKRRLDAEAIRDAMLAVSGELDLSPAEGSLVAKVIGDRPISLIGLDKRVPKDLDGSLRRSVYLPVIRDRLPDALEIFDFAEPSLVTGDRETTNVPTQALYLMNSLFVLDRSRGFAERLLRETESDETRVERAFQLCFSRSPLPEEAERSLAYLASEKVAATEEDGVDKRPVLLSFCQALLSTAEFRNLD